MNILITGNLLSLAKTLAEEFSREGNKIVLVSERIEQLKVHKKNIATHSINPADIESRDILSSYKFDIVIFMSTREEQINGTTPNTGQQLDGLRNILELCRQDLIKQFFFVSSTEIYGEMDETLENIEPKPASINGYTLYSGEQYCKLFSKQYGLNVTVLRVPFIFGPDEQDTLLYRIVQDCIKKFDISISATENTECSFLYSADVADFFLRFLRETHTTGYQVINLSSSKKSTYADLLQLLDERFQGVKLTFSGENIWYTRPVVVTTAKELYDWVDLHEVDREFNNYVDSVINNPNDDKRIPTEIIRKISDQPNILRWVELLLGAVLMQFLSEFTGTLIQFKYVDFRLLFVILMGLVYGIRFGLFASILASLSVLYTWYDLGYDWALLAYNVGNWFPFAVYFAAGIITGYYRDKTENTIEYEKSQKDLIYSKYEFLYGVFEEIRKLKDEFREQLIGYRDSFGKIYKITRELGTLQEHEIFYKSLGVLEELMDNKSIAIYSLDPNRVFARLEINSRPLNERISKSLKLSDFPEALDNIEKGIIFQNTSLLPNYPAYIAPILKYSYPFNVPVALVVIWDAKFEQYSMYYYNLFKVICNLIQDSLVRATTIMNMNHEKRYLPSTNILTGEAFVDALRTKEEIKKKGVAEYQLLKIQNEKSNVQDLSKKITEGIRDVDIIGSWSDNNYFVLLSQTDKRAVKDIIKRLNSLGVKGEVVDGGDFLLSIEK